MIIGMIKAHPIFNRMPGKQRPSLALAAHSIAVAVEPVRVGWPDREVAATDVGAVQVWRRRRDAEVGVGRMAVARRRPGGARQPAPGGRRGRPRPSGRGRRPHHGGGGRLRLSRGGWLGRGGGAGRHDGGDDRGHRDRAWLLLGSGTTGSRASNEPDHSPDETGGPGASPPRQLAWRARRSRRWWRSPAGRRPLLGWLPPITAARWDWLGGSVGHQLAPSASSLSAQTPRCQQRRQDRLGAQICLDLPKQPELLR